ncbi:MAG: fructosamine kinase family protein [Thiohalospira sp.]
MTAWNTIAERIEAATGRRFRMAEQRNLGGGCISAAYRVEAEDGRQFFVKFNRASEAEMFYAEAEGLAEIAAAEAVRCPEPVVWDVAGDQVFLVMEYLPLGGRADAATARRLGEGLAAMHGRTRERFGWHRDNTIGSTPQPNGEMDDWVAFWRERRLGFQLDLAERNGYGRELREGGNELLERLGAFFSDHAPVPSLLHGDLWSGNWDVTADGEPVIFDPAVYYGDREADLAMTELFGGFPRDFYAAYDAAWARDAGYGVRRDLYNLYHILNHLNLFGTAYLGRARSLIQRLNSEAR